MHSSYKGEKCTLEPCEVARTEKPQTPRRSSFHHMFSRPAVRSESLWSSSWPAIPRRRWSCSWWKPRWTTPSGAGCSWWEPGAGVGVPATMLDSLEFIYRCSVSWLYFSLMYLSIRNIVVYVKSSSPGIPLCRILVVVTNEWAARIMKLRVWLLSKKHFLKRVLTVILFFFCLPWEI